MRHLPGEPQNRVEGPGPPANALQAIQDWERAHRRPDQQAVLTTIASDTTDDPQDALAS